jgi:hypothetical protein
MASASFLARWRASASLTPGRFAQRRSALVGLLADSLCIVLSLLPDTFGRLPNGAQGVLHFSGDIVYGHHLTLRNGLERGLVVCGGLLQEPPYVRAVETPPPARPRSS